MKERKISTYQAIAIVVIVMISHIILNMPNHLISQTGPATILNIFYVFGIALIVFALAAKIFDVFPNSDIIDICEYTAGKTFKNIYSVLICIYLIIIDAFVIRIFSESLALIYFPNVDLEIIILIFIAITTILNIFGFKAISRVTLIILPIILGSMFVIFISSSGDFVPERALPLLGYGASSTFISGLRKYLCF